MNCVLVTGGCGFIGSNFIRFLLQATENVRIVNLDKLTYSGCPQSLGAIDKDPRYSFVEGDICDQSLVCGLFTTEEFDTVVHFAAESHVDRSITGPSEFIQTNIVGTFILLEEARTAWLNTVGDNSTRKCFLHVSTDEVYGSLGETGYFTEKTAYDPRSPYSASKASSDHLVSSYFHTYGLPVITTNCSNNYGPYQFPEKLIPLIFNNALNGKELPVYGDGGNVRDWLFVDDHCRAIFKAIKHGNFGETYNVGGNEEKQNIFVVERVCDILDEKVGLLNSGVKRRSLIKFVKDRAGHDRRYAIDSTKITAELGWSPQVNFADGIRLTIDWYLDNSEWVSSVLDGSNREYCRNMYGELDCD